MPPSKLRPWPACPAPPALPQGPLRCPTLLQQRLSQDHCRLHWRCWEQGLSLGWLQHLPLMPAQCQPLQQQQHQHLLLWLRSLSYLLCLRLLLGQLRLHQQCLKLPPPLPLLAHHP